MGPWGPSALGPGAEGPWPRQGGGYLPPGLPFWGSLEKGGRSFLLPLAPPGSPWLPLTLPGSSWLLLAPPGSWLLLAQLPRLETHRTIEQPTHTVGRSRSALVLTTMPGGSTPLRSAAATPIRKNQEQKERQAQQKHISDNTRMGRCLHRVISANLLLPLESFLPVLIVYS